MIISACGSEEEFVEIRNELKLKDVSTMNVRFQYKSDIRVDCFERLLSSESGHSPINIKILFSTLKW